MCFAHFVSTLGFTHSKSDHSLFIYWHGGDMNYLLLYVGDTILTTAFDALRKSIMARLSSKFAMKNLGPLRYFLGIVVARYAGGLFLSQRKYALQIIERVGMSSCKLSPTPVDRKPKMSAHASIPYEDPFLSRSLIRAL
ncbi:uncharacterized mitochondrial protein AtMg00810-like [Beta vulgaris subsp. vulgaris]|uniref:uncharacterized mitochondrial protein AtMg00810-like n=1 Tax=Beta vulgaris subsp. vulgaris TaxID=3555 RepID=UPI0020375862|nr:uncharacterized mitochondrial protein AtMg00810-like [Beta vulgaris subsp. vulgaris]